MIQVREATMKKPPFIKPFKKEDYEECVKAFDWDELAIDLIKLELEFEELKPHLSAKELQVFQQLIEIYETEKAFRVSDQYDHSRRYYGEQSFSIPETELNDEDLENM
jgi:hypothetical protein